MSEVAYEEWYDTWAKKCYGLRHQMSREPHGIVRVVTEGKGSGKCIQELTYKHRRRHGLERKV